jgi:GNAT superfamily N-acetyltransferase
MPTAQTLAILDHEWARNFGCSPEELRGPGITLLANAADFADYQGAYLLRWEDGSAVFTVPSPLLATVAAAIRGRPVAEVFDRAFLSSAFGERAIRIIGPASRNCADATDFRPVDPRGTRHLTDADHAALRRLAAACDPEEWSESGLGAILDGGPDATRPPHFGCLVGGELAAAGMLRPHGPLRNIYIATHPGYRRRGYGRAVVSAMTAHALGEGTIPHYQALAANGASLALARSLGFVRYATSLAVRLNLAGAAPRSAAGTPR